MQFFCVYCMVNVLSFKMHDERSVIGKNLFKKETNIQPFVGLKVQLSTGLN